jgi:hypothetical protein
MEHHFANPVAQRLRKILSNTQQKFSIPILGMIELHIKGHRAMK